MFKQLTWVTFDENHLIGFINGEEAGAELQPPLSALIAALQKLKCKSVLIENDYIDGDFKNEFAHYYCKSFKIYPSRCIRLHFLGCSHSGLVTLDLETLTIQNYLGFCVVRPTESNRIGRTVIRFPEDGNAYVTCKKTFDVHLAGKTFSVEGFPFIQQDTHVGVCAHASMWMVARYMQACGYCGRYGLGDINLKAKRFVSAGRDLPSDQGLSHQQMLDALQGMGLVAQLYDRANLPENPDQKNEFEKMLDVADPNTSLNEVQKKKLFQSIQLAELAYRYIESRLPVIFITEDHVFVGVGHGFDPANTLPWLFGRVPNFIIHDDYYGPYQSLPVLNAATQPAKAYHNLLDVTGILVVTPPSVNLLGEHAENQARSMVEQMQARINTHSGFQELHECLVADHEFRTYLLDCCELQRDLRAEAQNRPPDSHIQDLLRLDYPHYVWVTEIFVPAEPNGSSVANRKCVGRCFVDSTGSRLVSNIMYFNYGPLFMLRDRQGIAAEIAKYENNFVSPQEKQMAATFTENSVARLDRN